MKGYSGRQVPALLLVLLCMFPVFAGAQGADTAGGMEERVETGRFGVEEPEEAAAAAEETGHANRWLYLGVRAGPSMGFYTPEGDTRYTGNDTYSFALDTAVHANVQILPFLSLQGEMVFTWDRASVWAYVFTPGSVSSHNRHTQDYRSFSLAFPFTARFNFYPGKFRVSPFFGLYYLVPLGNMKHTDSRDKTNQSWPYDLSLPLGLLGGVSGGVKTGPGILFMDLRYAVDLGKPEFPDPALVSYRRSVVTLAVGYEFGFFAKKTGKKP